MSMDTSTLSELLMKIVITFIGMWAWFALANLALSSYNEYTGNVFIQAFVIVQAIVATIVIFFACFLVWRH